MNNKNLLNTTASLNKGLKILCIFAFLFVIYLLFVILWRNTSGNYPPAGIFDHITRQGPELSEWSDSRTLHKNNDWIEGE